MNTFFYIIIFIIGTLFGSFFTLAVYRLPKGQDITHTHSYCPNCGSKLGFFELIPVLSYIFIKGKCVHCGLKIRIRYLVLEVLSGIVFLTTALSLGLNVYNLNLDLILHFAFILLYISTLFIIAGIDKENKNINKGVLSFGLILGICFMIYACIMNQKVIYTYIIYLLAILGILILDNFILKKKQYENYTISILYLSIYMIIAAGTRTFIFTALLAMAMVRTCRSNKKNKNGQKGKYYKYQRRKKAPNTNGILLINIKYFLISTI